MTSRAHAYTVTGMTCRHCVLSVREEVAAVAGVEQVEVDLDTGRLSIAGAGFTDDEIRAAVASAGYELAAPARNGGAGGNPGN